MDRDRAEARLPVLGPRSRGARRERVEAAEAPPAAAKSRARRAWPLVGTVLAVAVALAALASGGGVRRRSTLRRAPRGPIAVPLTTYPGWEVYPTLSPDGSQVAFSWEGSSEDNRDIYLKLVGPGEPHRLTTDPAPTSVPRGRPTAAKSPSCDGWPSESRSLGHIPDSGSGRSGTPARGNRLRRAKFRSAPGGLLAWTPDGRWLAAAGRFGPGDPSEIWLLSPETGERRRLTVAGERPDW